MDQTGVVLDQRYELLDCIGFGGMANVYRARCVGTDYYVAVKILKQEYNEDEAFVRKFIAEAKSTEGLAHENIVKIYDAGRDRGLYYIVMELAEGMTLKQYIKRYGRLSARETVDLSIQIARAIQAAHEHGIIHRDIKPQNILVSESGRIKVTDFGIAKAVTSDTINSDAMGSVRYFSPEQARGGYSDERSDIYSLGITIYEMATGRVPFDGDNSVAIALMHLRDEITPPRDYFPDIPKSLENIIMKCVRKKPEERYQTPGELIRDLKRVFESPDGNYVYLTPLVDDSPTRARTREEIETVRKKLTGTGQEEAGTGGPPEETDEGGDEDSSSRFERMIMLIAICLGVAFSAFLIFAIGSSMNLFRLPFGKETAEATTQAPATTATEATTETAYVSVPDFSRLTREKALARAEKHSLTVQFTEEHIPSDYPKDQMIVTSQFPEKGTEVEEGSEVQLTLGADENLIAVQVEVPYVVNMQQVDAIDELESAGLKASIIYATSESVRQGYVIRQNPAEGAEVERGFTVTLTVSKGLGQVKVPTLSGVSRDAAEKMLNDVGLKLGEVKSDYSGAVGVGDVIEQDIPAGSLVDKGTEVSIIISLGEEETYHYEGVVPISNSPFSGTESGSIEIVVEQAGREDVIFSRDYVNESSFPLNVDYSSQSGEEATAVIYINGKEYNRFKIDLSAVAD